MFKDFLNNDGLSLDRLHTLVLLADAGSLTKAAGNNPGKQTRMSHHLRELGEFFHVALTERSGRTLKLTQKGYELAQIARNHLSTLQTFARSVQTTDHEWAIGAGDSVLQWWLIPALGRRGLATRWSLHNLRTTEIVSRVADARLDFGLVRSDSVRDSVKAAQIGTITYAIVVPRRLLRGNLSTKTALAELPHATIGTDGQMAERLRNIASDLGSVFQARLKCDSLGMCLAAVRTGRYAAVLPTYILDDDTVADVEIVEADLEELNRPMALIWNPRTVETLGHNAVETRDALLAALKAEDEERRREG
jgi:DNA-binding transcriptional LysR family regulator